ncbi:MAG: ATP synthase F0 subunit B [Aquificaceae bacterium]
MSEGNHTLELIWKGLNILAFLGIVYYFGRRPIQEAFRRYFIGLTERLLSSEEELKSAKEEVQKAKESLQDTQRRYQEQLKLAQQTANTIREEEEKKVQEVANRIREKTKEVIDIELKKAKEDLYHYGAERAHALAVEMLRERFKDEKIQKAYIEKALGRLEVKE